MSQGSTAWQEIDAARRYSLSLLDDFSEKDWFRQPAEGVTHVAFRRVGHLGVRTVYVGADAAARQSCKGTRSSCRRNFLLFSYEDRSPRS